jgi:hypothetical protein
MEKGGVADGIIRDSVLICRNRSLGKSNAAVFIPNGTFRFLLRGVGLLTVGVAVGRRLREVGGADNGRNFVEHQNISTSTKYDFLTWKRR